MREAFARFRRSHEFWLFAVVIVLCVLLSLATDSFFTLQNLFDLLTSNAFIGVLCAGLTLWALRDLIAPVRLAADPTGVTVLTGIVGRRHVPWSAIERIRVDRTSRRGLTSELLELDAGDALFYFSANALGAMPEDVAAELANLRVTS